jgi:hypothetical protein
LKPPLKKREGWTRVKNGSIEVEEGRWNGRREKRPQTRANHAVTEIAEIGDDRFQQPPVYYVFKGIVTKLIVEDNKMQEQRQTGQKQIGDTLDGFINVSNAIKYS